MKSKAKIPSLILWYLPVAFIQFLSSRVTIASINPWYKSLNKAPWNPPPWVFGPTWMLLYLMMAVAVWIVFLTKPKTSKHKFAYTLFFMQLLVNGAWSFLFFGMHSPGWALVDLIVLIFLLVLTFVSFYRICSLAGWLLIPYLIWSLYALTLNAAIFWMN
ncbi:MAG: tryptophan-rich sensory protein [Chlamydiales bacterium]|nr:tryptophan-rich sensory protein [Chlamydiia bacterium]MCP5503856.1 tryptophan-rich sensory protein [Chlamydiales bacterium]